MWGECGVHREDGVGGGNHLMMQVTVCRVVVLDLTVQFASLQTPSLYRIVTEGLKTLGYSSAFGTDLSDHTIRVEISQ